MHHLPRYSTNCVQQTRLRRRVFLYYGPSSEADPKMRADVLPENMEDFPNGMSLSRLNHG
jgi:hypothetical protein